MSNYNQRTESTTVDRWYAARSAHIDNAHGQAPRLTFREVERSTINGRLVGEVPTGRTLQVEVQEPGIVIPYIDPETYEQILDAEGNPIPGQCFTDEQFAYMTACVYIYAAKLADKSGGESRVE